MSKNITSPEIQSSALLVFVVQLGHELAVFYICSDCSVHLFRGQHYHFERNAIIKC